LSRRDPPSEPRFPTRSPWPGVELRHLVALQAVVAAGSFNAAAARLGYTQSAVSAQIRALERLVGLRLLDRSRGVRGVTLTPEGAALLEHATEIVAQFEAAADRLVHGLDPAAQTIRVGTFQSASQGLLPETLRRFAAAQPDVRVDLVERYDDESLLELVEGGSLDVTFAVLPLRKGPFASMELCSERFVALLPVGDPLAELGAVPLEELERRGPLDVEDCASLAALVGAGLGVGIAAAFAVANRPDVVERPVDVPPRPLAIVWHRERAGSLAVRQFVRLASAVGHTLPAPPAPAPERRYAGAD